MDCDRLRVLEGDRFRDDDDDFLWDLRDFLGVSLLGVVDDDDDACGLLSEEVDLCLLDFSVVPFRFVVAVLVASLSRGLILGSLPSRFILESLLTFPLSLLLESLLCVRLTTLGSLPSLRSLRSLFSFFFNFRSLLSFLSAFFLAEEDDDEVVVVVVAVALLVVVLDAA